MADLSVLSMHARLAAYFATLSGRRWQAGVLDCGIFLADWAVRLGVADPIADLRGAYADERGFLRIIRREGGFVRCCETRLVRAGLVEVGEAAEGDLAVVLAPVAAIGEVVLRRPTGAIATREGRFAVVTSDIGVLEAPLPVLGLWRARG